MQKVNWFDAYFMIDNETILFFNLVDFVPVLIK
jgi:hypothetical protein